jgi:hypothetical protein
MTRFMGLAARNWRGIYRVICILSDAEPDNVLTVARLRLQNTVVMPPMLWLRSA